MIRNFASVISSSDGRVRAMRCKDLRAPISSTATTATLTGSQAGPLSATGPIA